MNQVIGHSYQAQLTKGKEKDIKDDTYSSEDRAKPSKVKV